MKKSFVNLMLALAAAGCAATQPPATVPATAAPQATAATAQAAPEPLPYAQTERDLALAMNFLTGRWETFAQSRVAGTDFTPVTIRHAPIWVDRPGDRWIYAEYVHPGDEAHPFRQRIYRLSQGRVGTVSVKSYALPGDPATFAGEWNKDRPFARVKAEDLRELTGCEFVLERQMEMVLGGGVAGKTCHGDGIARADHEHWEFQVTSSSMRVWEAGMDASGKYAAGPSGAWEFRKMSRIPR